MPLYLTQRKRSPYWYIRGSIRGISIEESTGLSDKRQAEDVLALRQAEIVKRSIHGDPATRTFSEAALSYLEAGGERKYLAAILRILGTKPLAAIGQALIEEVGRKLYPRGSPSTLNRQVFTPIVAVLRHAARKRWCDRPVIERPKEPKGRVRWITPAEADLLVEASGDSLQPLLIFLLCTGARLSEALYLRWRDVDLSRAHVTFLDTKNGEDRGVPLHPRALAALANLPHRDGMVFRRHYGGVRWNGKIAPVGDPYADRRGIGGGQVKTAWSAMLRRADFTNFTPHDCRHTWATWHYQANGDLAQLMELGGWKSAEMVMRYSHVNVSRLAGSIGQIWVRNGNSLAEISASPLPLKA